MAKSMNTKARNCCHREKERLIAALQACDLDDPEERHQCYRRVAKESGQRAKECLISG